MIVKKGTSTPFERSLFYFYYKQRDHKLGSCPKKEMKRLKPTLTKVVISYCATSSDDRSLKTNGHEHLPHLTSGTLTTIPILIDGIEVLALLDSCS